MVSNYGTLKLFFSIVIPTYNCAELLHRLLKSIFSQPVFELPLRVEFKS